jgi:hypothetical protein
MAVRNFDLYIVAAIFMHYIGGTTQAIWLFVIALVCIVFKDK